MIYCINILIFIDSNIKIVYLFIIKCLKRDILGKNQKIVNYCS